MAACARSTEQSLSYSECLKLFKKRLTDDNTVVLTGVSRLRVDT